MRTSISIINIFCLFLSLTISSQQLKEDQKETPKDTVTYKTGYGLRLGVDISKPIISATDKDKSYTGFEIVGDYRISNKWYIAAEVGHEEEITEEDFTTSTSVGNYIKLGANLNTYNNWLDMNNEIYVGGRYGFALFEQTLNSYTPNVTTGDIDTDIYFPTSPITVNETETGLTAHWLEFVLGLKAETFKNLFIGVSGSFKLGLSFKDPDNFQTLYAPGFNRVYASDTGFGFNYTISYLIPFVNK